MNTDEFVERNRARLLESLAQLRAGKGRQFATVEEADKAAKAELRERAKNASAAAKSKRKR